MIDNIWDSSLFMMFTFISPDSSWYNALHLGDEKTEA